MLKSKSLFDYTNLFYPNDYQKNYKIILKYKWFNCAKIKGAKINRTFCFGGINKLIQDIKYYTRYQIVSKFLLARDNLCRKCI